MRSTGSSLNQNWGQHKGFYGKTTNKPWHCHLSYMQTKLQFPHKNKHEFIKHFRNVSRMVKARNHKVWKTVGQDPASSWKTGSWNFHLKENEQTIKERVEGQGALWLKEFTLWLVLIMEVVRIISMKASFKKIRDIRSFFLFKNRESNQTEMPCHPFSTWTDLRYINPFIISVSKAESHFHSHTYQETAFFFLHYKTLLRSCKPIQWVKALTALIKVK